MLNQRASLLSLAIGAIAFIAYLPALANAFVSFDDYSYVLHNHSLGPLSIKYLQWAFTTFQQTNWHPLTWVSYSVDFMLWGRDPMGYHLTNILLHALNSALVTLIAMRLWAASLDKRMNERAGAFALLVGVVFALHPLHVESVAWVSERKDVLYALWWLLGLWSYIEAKRIGRRLAYALTLLCFALSLLSKPMAVTFPVVLLLLDYYTGRLDVRAAMFKLPFFALSAASSALTIMAQKNVIVAVQELSLDARIVIASRAIWFYLGKLIMPLNLSPLYPLSEGYSFNDPLSIAALVGVAGLVVMCMVRFRKNTGVVALVAYYLITLIPVLGLVQVGSQAAADRYMYLPMLGPAGILAAAIALYLSPRRAIALTVALSIPLAALSLMQIKHWHDSKSLWSRAVSLAPRNAIVNLGYATYLLEANKNQEAMGYLDRALWIAQQPQNPDRNKLHNIYYLKGTALASSGLHEQAIALFDQSIDLNPRDPKYLWSRGQSRAALKQCPMAIGDFQRALALNPTLPNALNSLGLCLSEMGQYQEAISALSRAIAIDPSQGGLYYNRANALMQSGDKEAASQDYTRARSLGFRW